MPILPQPSRSSPRSRPGNRPIIFFFIALALITYLLLFIAANPQWVPVYLPVFPWSQSSVWFGFETRISAVVAIGMLIGAGIASAVLVPLIRNASRQHQKQQQQLDALTRELEKTERLMTHSRRD